MKSETYVYAPRNDKDDNERTKQAVRAANDRRRGREKWADLNPDDD
jgi:hypothetical protein